MYLIFLFVSPGPVSSRARFIESGCDRVMILSVGAAVSLRKARSREKEGHSDCPPPPLSGSSQVRPERVCEWFLVSLRSPDLVPDRLFRIHQQNKPKHNTHTHIIKKEKREEKKDSGLVEFGGIEKGKQHQPTNKPSFALEHHIRLLRVSERTLVFLVVPCRPCLPRPWHSAVARRIGRINDTLQAHPTQFQPLACPLATHFIFVPLTDSPSPPHSDRSLASLALLFPGLSSFSLLLLHHPLLVACHYRCPPAACPVRCLVLAGSCF